MDKNTADKLIPEKKDGKSNDVEESVTCDSRSDALEKFNSAVGKLLDINSWQRTAATSAESAEFLLKDKNGNSIHDPAKEGDYIRIDVPGPGSKAGNGFDWVRIEKLIDQRDSHSDNEMIGFMVRACSDPTSEEKDTAHFFTDDSTSTFIIERKLNTIHSMYFGRNEVINTQTNIQDKIRNSLVGVGAKLGFSEIQWKLLIKGFLH